MILVTELYLGKIGLKYLLHVLLFNFLVTLSKFLNLLKNEVKKVTLELRCPGFKLRFLTPMFAADLVQFTCFHESLIFSSVKLSNNSFIGFY